jgi:hypothetical protein
VGDAWSLTLPDGQARSFPDRKAALVFALEQARHVTFVTRQPAYICVEGPDGRWRLFDPDLKPVAN